MTPEEALKQIHELLAKNRLKMGMRITFPPYDILPDEVHLAFMICKKHGMKIQLSVEQK